MRAGKENHSHRQQADDNVIDLAPGPGGNGLAAIDILFFFQALRRDFVRPGEKHRQREPQDNDGRKDLHDPGRRFKGREQDGRNFHQQPANHGISHGHPENVATLQLPEKRHPPVSPVLGYSQAYLLPIGGASHQLASDNGFGAMGLPGSGWSHHTLQGWTGARTAVM